MNIKTIFFIVFIFFSLFGSITFTFLIHELSHYNDFKEISEDGEICFLAFPEKLTIKQFFSSRAGWYKFDLINSDAETLDSYKKTKKYTEIKAYAISGLILFIYIISLISTIKRTNGTGRNTD